MGGGARVGWRVATAVAFGATAALAVIVSSGAPTRTALISAKAGGGHAASSASAVTAAPQCAISRLRLSVGPGVRVASRVTHGPAVKSPAVQSHAAKPPAVTRRPARRRGAAVAAALIRYRLDFTNVSRLPCTMTGYPQVAADENGMVVGGQAAHDTAVVAHRLLLAPGQTAHAALDASVPTPRCHPVRASGLRVVPPGQSSARYLDRPLTACSVRGEVYLHVRAVQAGADVLGGPAASTAGSPAASTAGSPAASTAGSPAASTAASPAVSTVAPRD